MRVMRTTRKHYSHPPRSSQIHFLENFFLLYHLKGHPLGENATCLNITEAAKNNAWAYVYSGPGMQGYCNWTQGSLHTFYHHLEDRITKTVKGLKCILFKVSCQDVVRWSLINNLLSVTYFRIITLKGHALQWPQPVSSLVTYSPHKVLILKSPILRNGEALMCPIFIS